MSIHPLFPKQFIRELLFAAVCVSSTAAPEIQCCCCEVLTTAEGIGWHYARQGRHSHGNAAHAFHQLLLRCMTDRSNPQSNLLLFSITSSVPSSLKGNKNVRLTRQRASCQSAVPLPERRGTISISKRRPVPGGLGLFPGAETGPSRQGPRHLPTARCGQMVTAPAPVPSWVLPCAVTLRLRDLGCTCSSCCFDLGLHTSPCRKEHIPKGPFH